MPPFPPFIKTFVSQPQKLFLLDGFGALLSAFLHGVVLVALESAIGMPRQILYGLALAACFFAVYSFTCSFLVRENWRPFLKGIAGLNLLYCGVTVVLLFLFRWELSLLGWLYFLVEIIVVVGLVLFEWRTASS